MVRLWYCQSTHKSSDQSHRIDESQRCPSFFIAAPPLVLKGKEDSPSSNHNVNGSVHQKMRLPKLRAIKFLSKLLLGLTNPRRIKLLRGTLLHIGHPFGGILL